MPHHTGNRFDGDVAVVTGSDSGIGQATAIRLAEEGADVCITYLHDREGAEHTRKVCNDHGARTMVVQFDQSDSAAVRELFRHVEAELGTPTVLVNNAGEDAPGVDVKDTTDELWDRKLKVDLYGYFYCTREFIQHFEAANGDGGKRGRIIMVSSVHQRVPRKGAATYDVAKGGVHNLVRTLALELTSEHHINVNAIAPGMVLTPFNQEARDDAEVREKMTSMIPLKRAAEPEDIANVIAFLASDEAAYMHGSTVVVDGGLMQNTGQGA